MFTTLNMHHWRAVKAWLDANQGRATLDMATHHMEVRARNRYYQLYPQFLAEVDGRLSHVGVLGPQATAFIGWRPYRPFTWRGSTDKLVFKRLVREAGFRTPDWWPTGQGASADHVLKRSVGSFGYQLAGPFRAGESSRLRSLPGWAEACVGQSGEVYAEQFVQGLNVKAWFWDGQPVHVHCHPYDWLHGDGRSTIQELADVHHAQLPAGSHRHREPAVWWGCLTYQGMSPSTVPDIGQQVWMDYRYGRGFQSPAVTEAEDNAWASLVPSVQAQIAEVGAWLGELIRGETRTPLLFSVDGVLDAQERVWWLEVNSNPICPPNAYFPMFATLFGTPPEAPPHAFAQARSRAAAPSLATVTPSVESA